MDVDFDFVSQTPIVPRAELRAPPFDSVHWSSQISGITISEPVARKLEAVWAERTRKAAKATSMPNGDTKRKTALPKGEFRDVVDETISDEAALLRTCLYDLGIGARQVVRTHTGLDRITVGAEPEVSRLVAYFKDGLKGVQTETLTDFFLKNNQPYPIEPQLTLDGQLVCVTAARLKRIFRDDEGWNRFRKAYPASHGRLEFSRVGFNKLTTQGLIYVGRQADWTAGYGGFYLYNLKPKKGWVLSADIMAWIS